MFDYAEYLSVVNSISDRNENKLREYLTANNLNAKATEAIIEAIETIPYPQRLTLLEKFVEKLHLNDKEE